MTPLAPIDVPSPLRLLCAPLLWFAHAIRDLWREINEPDLIDLS